MFHNQPKEPPLKQRRFSMKYITLKNSYTEQNLYYIFKLTFNNHPLFSPRGKRLSL